MAKPMHKKSFRNTFEVMEAPVAQGICLNRVDDMPPSITEVLIYWKVVEYWIDYQRPQILPEEECTVGDLWTQVFEYYSQVI